MPDYSQLETHEAVPEAASMIETFRAIGYGIEGAIADIVDNSISANAKEVWIDFDWRGRESCLRIKDNGVGMSNAELIEAMRPGSRNPMDERNPTDLGRFGLGLKTASFSQCRKLSVVSKLENCAPVYWTWDLDFVKENRKWELLKYLPEYDRFYTEVNELRSGTIVVWNDLDRLVAGFENNEQQSLDKFQGVMELVKKHLAMVFHRFIESKRVSIYFQSRPLKPWDPFLTRLDSTQKIAEDRLQNGKVNCRGFVLPHKSKISTELYKEAEGPHGWNEQQGFYIYRNERLLLPGDWLGMFRKEEHYKLARIRIDLPNTLDSEWQIDIKKSTARPPIAIRESLRAYAKNVRARAVEVYRHRGKSVRRYPGQQFEPLWVEHRRGDKWFYRINRENPIIVDLKQMAKSKPDIAFDRLLKFVEETIPTKSIYIKEAEEANVIGTPFEGLDQAPLRDLMQQMYNRLINDGKSIDEAKSRIANIEPFNHFPEFLEFLEPYDERSSH